MIKCLFAGVSFSVGQDGAAEIVSNYIDRVINQLKEDYFEYYKAEENDYYSFFEYCQDMITDNGDWADYFYQEMCKDNNIEFQKFVESVQNDDFEDASNLVWDKMAYLITEEAFPILRNM